MIFVKKRRSAALKKGQSPEVVTIGGISAPVTRSAQRKTTTIKIEAGQVKILAPTYVSHAQLKQFLQKKIDWVTEKLQIQQEQIEARPQTWQSGTSINFRGGDLRLVLEPGPRKNTHLDDSTLNIYLPASQLSLPEKVRAEVVAWLRRTASVQVNDRLRHWEKITGLEATQLKVRSYKARWGSCNHRGEISINWKLIMAPPAVLDYVIVHELCHRVHMNHSPQFWNLVERFQPDFAEHRLWLKRKGLTLEL